MALIRSCGTVVTLMILVILLGCGSKSGYSDASYDMAGFKGDRILIGTILYPASENLTTWAERCLEAYNLVMEKAKSSEHYDEMGSVVIMVAEEAKGYPKGLKIGQFKVFLKAEEKDNPAHLSRLKEISNSYAMLLKASTKNTKDKIREALKQQAEQ